MPLFADVLIKAKLRQITMLATIVALTLAGVAFVVYELFTSRSVMTRELSSMADIIGTNSMAALAFNDAQAARQTLQALQADSRILVATLYTKEGVRFATYRRQDLNDLQDLQESAIPVPASAEEGSVVGGLLQITRPILLDRERIGTISIQMNMSEVYGRLVRYAIIVTVVLLFSSLLMLLLTGRLQRVLVEPILHLVAVARRVSEQQDYSIRAARSTQDELGQLIDGFNEMLTQIQHRDMALQEAHGQLEAMVEHRTRQLEAAKQQAEEASRHKSVFLSNMSHELRTPLDSMLGFAWLLQDPSVSSLNETQTRFARNIVASGKHLLALINDLLDLSKVEAGKLRLQLHSFPLREAIEAAIYTIRPQAELKQQALELSMEGDMPVIKADPTRFRQILYNLLSNAVKFTPEGERIRVTTKVVPSTECREPDFEPGTWNVESGTARMSEWVEIAVSDTGIGIKPEDLPKLFQTFTQLEPAIAKQFQGTGLGLALTKQLVELHGGSIWAASEGEGRGSTFTVRLPLRPPHESPETGG